MDNAPFMFLRTKHSSLPHVVVAFPFWDRYHFRQIYRDARRAGSSRYLAKREVMATAFMFLHDQRRIS